MYRTLVRRLPLAGISLRTKAPRLATTSHVLTDWRRICSRPTTFTNIRAYSTSEDNQKSPETNTKDEVPPDLWLRVLESTASAPWLRMRPEVHEDILRRAFILIYQIILGLTMQRDTEAIQAFLFAFAIAPVAADSEIGRARRATATIAEVVIDLLSSIPDSSPLRKDHPKIFALHGALVPLADVYLRDQIGSVEEWREFWARVESPLLELNAELHGSGFGKDLDELQAKKNEGEDKQA